MRHLLRRLLGGVLCLAIVLLSPGPEALAALVETAVSAQGLPAGMARTPMPAGDLHPGLGAGSGLRVSLDPAGLSLSSLPQAPAVGMSVRPMPAELPIPQTPRPSWTSVSLATPGASVSAAAPQTAAVVSPTAFSAPLSVSAFSLAAPEASASRAPAPGAVATTLGGLQTGVESLRQDGSPEEAASALDRLFTGSRHGLLTDSEFAGLQAEAIATSGPALSRATVSGRAAAPKAEPAPVDSAQRKAARQALVGTAIYKFGMESLGVSMPLIALTYFGSALWMATMAMGWGASMTIASMFSGGLLDRKPVAKVMAGALLTQAVIVSGIIALLLTGAAGPWLILPLYSVAGLAQGVVLTARDTLPARILGRDQAVLSRFNAKMHLVYETAGTVAPLLVGLLMGKAGLVAGLFLLPPAYLLAALAFSRLKIDRGQEPAAQSPALKELVLRTISEVKAGARIVLGNKEFRWLGLIMVAPMVLHRLAEQMLTPIFAKSILGAPALAGWMVSGSNLGELFGAALLLHSLRKTDGSSKPSHLRWLRTMAVCLAGVWAFSAGASLWLVLPALLVMGLTFSANDISMSSYFQSRLPNDSAGKAIGFLMAVELCAIMLSSYLFGLLFDALSPAAALIVVGVVFSALAGLFYRGYFKLRAAARKA